MAALAFSAGSTTDSANTFLSARGSVPEAIAEIPDFQLRLTLWDSRETRITVRVAKGKFAGCVLEQGGACLLHPETMVTAAFGKIIEVGIARELFDLRGAGNCCSAWRSGKAACQSKSCPWMACSSWCSARRISRGARRPKRKCDASGDREAG